MFNLIVWLVTWLTRGYWKIAGQFLFPSAAVLCMQDAAAVILPASRPAFCLRSLVLSCLLRFHHYSGQQQARAAGTGRVPPGGAWNLEPQPRQPCPGPWALHVPYDLCQN